MSIAAGASVLALPNSAPSIDDTAFVADGARIVGDVSLAAGVSVWCNAVLRGDSAGISIGSDSNVQDNVSIHVDPEHGVTVGAQVSIGHNAVVHGCTIGDGTLVGMGAVILSGAKIGAGCLIAGGAVVLGEADIPAGSLVAGVPAKVRRTLDEDERSGLIANAAVYLAHSRTHEAATSA
ncbi:MULTISPECIES: gamma carbonic anhydrase family protein [unclassified Microbacterium]|uniref:gamma carbonic anhydrase family protein n=1 Tax=unclassified Microbacterium TaxID=2609290 RepID=UPI00109C37AB|nr:MULTISPECIES: gamma carbonic anhydrase family protein [unclassified Microbacterium]